MVSDQIDKGSDLNISYMILLFMQRPVFLLNKLIHDLSILLLGGLLSILTMLLLCFRLRIIWNKLNITRAT